MKKAFLIVAGTLSGLGAVLSLTPPALSGAVGEIGAPATEPVATKSVVTAQPVAAASGFTGRVNGASSRARSYGNVSVSATFSNGELRSVSASQSPRSWSDQSLSVIIPYVNGGSITIEQVKQFTSAQLPCSTSNSCNSRASYTADAFWASLKSAITKAGL